jgi:hypothetical protein
LAAIFRPPRNPARERAEAHVLREADRVIADYRRMDGAIRIIVEPKR